MSENRSAVLEISVEAQRRHQLLKAVIACVVEEGFEKTTLRKVAARAGVSTGMLAYYYKTKKDLINAAILEASQAFGEGLDADTSGSFGLRRLQLLLERSLKNDESSALLKNFDLKVRAAALHEPELRRLQYVKLEQGRVKVQRSISAAIEAGQLREDLDPQIAADIIYGLMIGLNTEMAVAPEIVSDEHVLAVCDAALALLSGPGPTGSDRGEQAPASPNNSRRPLRLDHSGNAGATTPDAVTRELLDDQNLSREAATKLAEAFRIMYGLAIGGQPVLGFLET